jgi:hypothetical protein
MWGRRGQGLRDIAKIRANSVRQFDWRARVLNTKRALPHVWTAEEEWGSHVKVCLRK